MNKNETSGDIGPYQLGSWLIDPGACRISQGERVTKVEPRAMAVLSHLARHHGRTVSRGELLDEIWKTRHVVEEALTKCISQLRQALEDDSRKPLYIETIPKLGYRLLLPPGAIQSPAIDTPAEPLPAPSGAVGKPWRWALLVCGLMVVIALLYLNRSRPDPVRLSVSLPGGTGLVEFTAAPLAVTANGDSLILALRDSQGSRLWRRRINAREFTPITGTEGASSPFLSPDNQWIAFAAQGKIKRVNIAGGEAQIITDAEQFFGGCWLGEQTIVFAPRFARGLWKVPASGGKPEPLTVPDAADTAHIWPACLPDGRTILFSQWRGGSTVDQSAIGYVTVDRRAQGVLLEGAYYPRYLRSGHLLFARVGTLMAVPLDLKSHTMRGAPQTLFNGVLTNVNAQVSFYETSNSAHLVIVQGRYEQPERRLLWVSRNGEVELASALHKPFSSPRVSPDGRRVAVWLQDDEVGVWLLDRARDQLSKLSRGLDDHSPVWSPDGRRVAFDSSRSGHYQLYTAPADSAGEETPMTTGSLDRFVNAWLPGDRLLVTEHSMENGSDVSWIDVSANPEPQPLLHSPFMEGEPAISADGQRIAYVSDESGRKQIYVQRMSPAGPPTGPRLQVSREGGEEPVWSRSGDELFFRSGPALFSVRVSREGELSTSEPRLLFSGSFHYNLYPTATYDVAPDGRFLMVEEPPVQNRTLLVTLHARP